MSEWQPIETAPRRHGFSIIAYTENRAVLECYWCPIDDATSAWAAPPGRPFPESWLNGFCLNTEDGTLLDSPTHWIPFPVFPNKGK